MSFYLEDRVLESESGRRTRPIRREIRNLLLSRVCCGISRVGINFSAQIRAFPPRGRAGSKDEIGGLPWNRGPERRVAQDRLPILSGDVTPAGEIGLRAFPIESRWTVGVIIVA